MLKPWPQLVRRISRKVGIPKGTVQAVLGALFSMELGLLIYTAALPLDPQPPKPVPQWIGETLEDAGLG